MPYASVFPDLAEHRTRIVYLLTRGRPALHFWRRTRWPGARPPVRVARSWRDADCVRESDATYDSDPTHESGPSPSEFAARADDASRFVLVDDADLRALLVQLRGLHAQSDLIEWALSRVPEDAGETCAASAIKDAIQALIDDVQAMRG